MVLGRRNATLNLQPEAIRFIQQTFKIHSLIKHLNMENKKGINIFLLMIAIILGSASWKQFDFNTFKFEKPALAALYLIVFAASIYFMIKDYKNR